METTAHHIKHTGTIEDMMKKKLLPDVVETVTDGATSSSSVTKNGYMRFSDRAA